MSLMLNALKRIEAKQMPGPVQEALDPVEPIVSPSTASSAEMIELPPELPADSLPSIPTEDLPPSESISLEAAMDQLQAFVSDAGSLCGPESKFDAADFQAEQPVAGLMPIETVATEEAATGADETPAPAPSLVLPEAESDGSEIEFTETVPTPEVEPPVVAAVGSDPYAATAQQILQQIARSRSQLLLFTSPADGQGKTMTLARLAPRFVQGMEGNVLVVDANFRNPDMARWMSVAPTWRLPDVLAGVVKSSAALQTTAHERVSLLPGGTDASSAGLGRYLQGLSQLLRDLTGHYGLVVVDASSLAHRGTAQLAAVCDGTYLVVQLGEVSPRMVREAAQLVHRHGGRLMGCVAIA